MPYLGWFLVIFLGLQFWPLSESAFSPNSPWDVLFAAAMCARFGSELSPESVAACEQLSGATLGTALGEIAGDIIFAAFIVGLFWLVARWRRKRGEDSRQATWPLGSHRKPPEV
jgi:hypothetical protein